MTRWLWAVLPLLVVLCTGGSCDESSLLRLHRQSEIDIGRQPAADPDAKYGLDPNKGYTERWNRLPALPARRTLAEAANGVSLGHRGKEWGGARRINNPSAPCRCRLRLDR